MKVKYLLEKVLTGKNVIFSVAEADSSGYKGNKIIKVVDLDNLEKKYYIYHSLINFVRFKDWVGSKAEADIQILKSKPTIKTKEGEKLYPIEINTEVEVNRKTYKDNSDKKNWYDEL